MIAAVHYSVEKWFDTHWTTTDIAYGGAEYVRGSNTNWIAAYILAQIGQPSRATAYSATVLLSINVFSVTSQRAVRGTAGTLEGVLRGTSIPLYDPDDDWDPEADPPTVREIIGYLRLQDPEFKAPRNDGQLHAGTVDVRGTLDMEV